MLMASSIPETYALLILAFARISTTLKFLEADESGKLTLIQILAEVSQTGICEEEEIQFP